jgi:RND family efflux transporter MFP subunit
MKKIFKNRTLVLIAVLVPILALFAYTALRSGPLAPIPVTVAAVENIAIAPAVFGIGTVQARFIHRIGPTVAGRVERLEVHVGDRVAAGQMLGRMDGIDLDERIQALEAAIARAGASLSAAEARIVDAEATFSYTSARARREESLVEVHATSRDTMEAKQMERQVAKARLAAVRADLSASRHELARYRAERDALIRQRENLDLVSPVDGLVTQRAVDPGTTVVAGQTVVEVIDPSTLWIEARFDQLQTAGLGPDLPARIVMRSRPDAPSVGRVLRIEPLADAVTEEMLAKATFDVLPDPLPPLGELAEVTVDLPPLPPRPTVATASVQRYQGRLGVWAVEDGGLAFVPVKTGASDLEGRIQILEGLEAGRRVVVYSHRALSGKSRIEIVERIPGTAP